MKNGKSENGADQVEDAAAPMEGDAGSDTQPAVDLEVTVRPTAIEMELKKMKDDLKDFIKKWLIANASSIEADQKGENDELRRLYK